MLQKGWVFSGIFGHRKIKRMAAWVREILCVEIVCAKTDGVFTQLDPMNQMLIKPFRHLAIQKCPQEIYPNDSSTLDDLLSKFIAEVALVIPNGSEIGVAGNDLNRQMMSIVRRRRVVLQWGLT